MKEFDLTLLNSLNESEILMSYGWDFKIVSNYAETDIFALGSSKNMDIYSNVINNINYYSDVIFHPETLIGYNMHINGLIAKYFDQFSIPPPSI